MAISPVYLDECVDYLCDAPTTNDGGRVLSAYCRTMNDSAGESVLVGAGPLAEG